MSQQQGRQQLYSDARSFCILQLLRCQGRQLPYMCLAMTVTTIIGSQLDLCLQLFGSASHGGLPSEAGARASGRRHHNSPNSALPHPFPRQIHSTHPEPVSLDSAHAGRNRQPDWCTRSCLSWVCRCLLACLLYNTF